MKRQKEKRGTNRNIIETVEVKKSIFKQTGSGDNSSIIKLYVHSVTIVQETQLE